jgi:hypothetical protein
MDRKVQSETTGTPNLYSTQAFQMLNRRARAASTKLLDTLLLVLYTIIIVINNANHIILRASQVFPFVPHHLLVL